jgi:signal transduction histidine kinase
MIKARSLRSRLLVWYSAILAVVIAAFGGAVSFFEWQAQVADVDVVLAVRAEALASALDPVGDGRFDLTLPPAPPASTIETVTLYHALWTEAGRVIDLADPHFDVPIPEGPGVRTRDGRRELTILAPSGALVLVGRDLADVRAEIWSLVGIIGGVGFTALGLSLLGGWILVSRALAPVDRISDTAQKMIEGDFEARVPVDQIETEFGRLAHALNQAFDRLNASLDRQRRFTADASHELRTPLAALSTEAEWALGRERRPDEYQESLNVSLRAARRMQKIVERLLVLARADAGADLDQPSRVRLDDLVRRVVADLEPLAATRTVTIDVDAERASVWGNPDRLTDAVTNLVDNAIRYNVDGGRVQVTVRANGTSADLTVEDSGVGIEPGDLGRVFEPFFRGDTARNRDSGGAGLGLTVTRALVERHGGRIRCTSERGRGTVVAIHLPVLVPGGEA